MNGRRFEGDTGMIVHIALNVGSAVMPAIAVSG
jgi:hypothetical protein